MISGKAANMLIVDDLIKEATKVDLGLLATQVAMSSTSLLPEVRKVIEGALRILDSAEHWCQGHDAVNTREMVMKPIPPDKSFLMNYKASPNPSECIQTVMVPKPVDARMPEANAFCAQGAVIRSFLLLGMTNPTDVRMHRSDYHMVVFSQVMNFLGKHVPAEWCEAQAELQHEAVATMHSVVRYNDHKDTTFEDVRLVFKKALHSLDD